MGEKETWSEAKKADDKGVRDDRLDDDPEARVKGSKSNPSEQAEPGAGGDAAAATSNLNLSKSNIDRTANAGDLPTETAINTSHSNIKNLRTATGGGEAAGDGDGLERTADAGPGDDPAAGTVVKSRSNITNN